MRAIIGYKPVDDQRADELSNKNINQSPEEAESNPVVTDSDNSVGNTPVSQI